MAFLSTFIEQLQVGDLQEYENLAIFPLIMPESREQGYLLLDEALSRGALEIREVSDAGSVNEIFVRNLSDSPVLKIALAEVKAYPSVGMGEDCRIAGEGMTGSCLVLGDRIIHLAVFEKVEEGRKRRTILSSPSRRRFGISL